MSQEKELTKEEKQKKHMESLRVGDHVKVVTDIDDLIGTKTAKVSGRENQTAYAPVRIHLINDEPECVEIIVDADPNKVVLQKIDTPKD